MLFGTRIVTMYDKLKSSKLSDNLSDNINECSNSRDNYHYQYKITINFQDHKCYYILNNKSC